MKKPTFHPFEESIFFFVFKAREFDDPHGLHEKTEYLLREWVQLYHSPQAGRDSFKAFNAFVQQVISDNIDLKKNVYLKSF